MISCLVSRLFCFFQKASTNTSAKALYGNKSITQLELVQKIQYSLQELHNTGRSFPRPLMLDFNKPVQLVTRTGASLYLMLFQVSLFPAKAYICLLLTQIYRLSSFVLDLYFCNEPGRQPKSSSRSHLIKPRAYCCVSVIHAIRQPLEVLPYLNLLNDSRQFVSLFIYSHSFYLAFDCFVALYSS
jgi:hypothetical protein